MNPDQLRDLQYKIAELNAKEAKGIVYEYARFVVNGDKNIPTNPWDSRLMDPMQWASGGIIGAVQFMAPAFNKDGPLEITIKHMVVTLVDRQLYERCAETYTIKREIHPLPDEPLS